MHEKRTRGPLRLALPALLAAALGLGAMAHGQEPEPDPDLELTAADVADDALEAADEDPPEEYPEDDAVDAEPEAVDDEPADELAEDDTADDEPEAADEPDAADVSDFVEDDSDWPADGEWQSVPMEDGEDWAAEVIIDESRAAIQLDRELNPTGEDWESLEPEVDGAGPQAGPATSSGDTNRWRGVPVIKRPMRRTRPAGAGGQDTPYSTGGKPVGDQGVPWQAQIYYPFSSQNWADELKKGTPLWSLQHECGGTLIAADWVLTAAHCIDEGMVRKGYRVRLGAMDLSKDDGMTFKIDRIVRHSQYANKGQPEEGPLPPPPNMYANDIALVHIVDDGPPRRRDPARIRPIPLHAGPLPKGAPVSATGWGKTEDVSSYQRSAVLMRVDLQVMDTKRCAELPEYGPRKIHGKVICAAREGRSTCAGDSGGAITPTNGAPVVVGIVSWGKGRCSGDGQPGVYTRVASYREWIQQAMRLDPTKNALP